MEQRKVCHKCGRSLSIQDFYTSNDKTKFPDGRFNDCKKCLTMHINNLDPDTYLPILQDADVPYVEGVWNEIYLKLKSGTSPLTGTSVIGRYITRMKLAQFGKKRWADSKECNDKYNEELRSSLMNDNSLSEGEKDLIAEADNPAKVLMETQTKRQGTSQTAGSFPVSEDFKPQYNAYDELLLKDLSAEDIKYLTIAWGDSYRPSEWVSLEKLYQEMLSSYDIQTAGHRDTLKLACKASLKTNQLLDLGDIDGALKAGRMYDMMMKSGKFELWTMKNFSTNQWGLRKAS